MMQSQSYQKVILIFEMKRYEIPLVGEITINELKSNFCQNLQLGDPQSYECSEINGRKINGEEIVQDAIKRTYFNFFKLVKVTQENNLIEKKQLIIQRNNQVPKHPEYQNQKEFFKCNWRIEYKGQGITILCIPNVLMNSKQFKNTIASEFMNIGQLINSDYFELQDQEKNIITKNKEIIARYFESEIKVIDQKQIMENEPNLWKRCLLKEELQTKLKYTQIKNDLFNLKFANECQNQKEKALFKVFPLASQLNISRIFFIGPKKTPYFEGIYELLCKLPEDFPYESPQIYFVTQIYHPNIKDGVVTLTQDWKPTSTIDGLIFEIISYLREPNFEFTLNQECAIQYEHHRDVFHQLAEDQKKQYANPDLDVIVKSLIGDVEQFNYYYEELLEEFEEWIINWVHQ